MILFCNQIFIFWPVTKSPTTRKGIYDERISQWDIIITKTNYSGDPKQYLSRNIPSTPVTELFCNEPLLYIMKAEKNMLSIIYLYITLTYKLNAALNVHFLCAHVYKSDKIFSYYQHLFWKLYQANF